MKYTLSEQVVAIMDIYDLSPLELMQTLRDSVERELENFFRTIVPTWMGGICQESVESIREFTMRGGKRVRPILMITGHDLFSPFDQKVVRASISIELTQSYLLIHDDIMDQSDTRRGKPSLHAFFRNKFSQIAQDPKRLSENVAIVAGDLAEAFAHRSLLESGLDSNALLSANIDLSRIIEFTGYGQLIDITSAFESKFSQKDLLRLHLLKTAKYTVEGPLMMGAHLSETKSNLRPLSYYGLLTGIAFQLHDDILGLFGNEAETGKSIKSDVIEGKKTLLVLKAVELSSKGDADFLLNTLGRPDIGDGDFIRFRKIVENSGSLDYSISLIEKLNAKSKEYLESLEGDRRIKNFLSWFADYLIQRKH
ncbi:MAG: polyprenyl synthetase family protein [Thermoplasmataceae archaeon]